jgi:hypothetical protein
LPVGLSELLMGETDPAKVGLGVANLQPADTSSLHFIFCTYARTDPIYADPIYADPIYADPIYADPIYAIEVFVRCHPAGRLAATEATGQIISS